MRLWRSITKFLGLAKTKPMYPKLEKAGGPANALNITTEKATPFDHENEVTYTWRTLLQAEEISTLHEFIQLAMQDDAVSQLFPFTSLYTLRLSRCTKYPFASEGLPNITPNFPGSFSPVPHEILNAVNHQSSRTKMTYIISNNKRELLGIANAEEALKIVKVNLPSNIGPAVRGTAEDLPH